MHGLTLASTSQCAGMRRMLTPLATFLHTARHHTQIVLHRSSYLTQKPTSPRHGTGGTPQHTPRPQVLPTGQRGASFTVGGWRTLRGPA